MKELIGKVVSFNDYSGRIMVDDVEYLLLDNNIVSGEVICNNDMVSFIPEEMNGFLIARFVKKVVNK
ncbi:MAG: hypothetical protein IJI49_02615 [Bacilli bacterium]|nr:hypothetical protein [Bacilli bacterium]